MVGRFWVSVMFLFVKQKTAYVLRISDWSSDVCSSDLHGSASIEIGDDKLKSEQGYKWINTFHLQEENLNIEISAYAHYLNHYIYLNPTGEIQESLRGAFPVFDYMQTRSEEHTSELQSLMRISYAVFCLKKKKDNKI